MKDDIFWKKIEGFDRYLVSSYGDVFSRIRKGRMLKPTLGNHGYYYVSLMKKGFSKPEKFLIHRLVAGAFLEGENETVNHIDGVKTNNFYKNLEWVSHKENINHAFNNGLNNGYCHFHIASKLAPSDVLKIKELLSSGVAHSKIAKQFDIARQTVTKINNNVSWRRLNEVI